MSQTSHPWGEPVWSFPVAILPHAAPEAMHVDVAIVGAGFTGLATAYYVLEASPDLRVVVLEAQRVGAGASGRTGGLVLEDTAVGPLPGVEDCIATLRRLVSAQGIDCDLRLGHCWEIGRYEDVLTSPIHWDDHGTLRVVKVIPGGVFDPRKFLAGLVTLVQRAGGKMFEQMPVTGLQVGASEGVRLEVGGTSISAAQVVFATNAFCLPLLGLEEYADGVHTIAVATEPLTDGVFEVIGWATRTPFYTLDQPYLWGRATADGRALIGAGLVGWGEVERARVDSIEAVSLFDRLEQRIHGLHPALRQVQVTHRWMGPLCMTRDRKPILTRLNRDDRVLVASGYGGHGVALSVRVGKLLAGVLSGQGELPAWSQHWASRLR